MLMKTFGWSRDHCLDMDGAESWVWYNWAMINESSVWGGGRSVKGDNYVAQERNRLLAEKQNGQ